MSLRFQHLVLLLIACTSFTGYSQKNKEQKFTPEQAFVQDNFPLTPPSKWKPGEKFMFVNSQLNITLKREKPLLHDTTDYKNQIFFFDSFKEQTDWNGNSTLDLRFCSNNVFFRFETGKSLQQFADESYNPLIPGLIWLNEIEKADSLLRNKTCYILSSEWIGTDGSAPLDTYKFVPITIQSVVPGNELTPIKVIFKDHKNREFAILISLSGTLSTSTRFSFHKVFAFTNPRFRYKDISDEHWELITRGKLVDGMTQGEVRLSIGKPSEINRIPTYSGLREQWFYQSGTMINFQDGKIVSFRQ